MIIGLTGGVGSGKSTVSALLAKHGATIVDADVIAREVVEPGTPGFEAVVARFGPSVVGKDGALDRGAIAEIVFRDPTARHDLNAIIHPLVAGRSAQLIAAALPHSVVVYDVPLLVESGMAPNFDEVVVVLADEDVRLRRLAERGMGAEQARARMDAQADDAARRAVADVVIDNNGGLDELAEQVDSLWERLREAA